MSILLTGAAGFVGHHVLRHLLVNTQEEIVCPVSYRHKGLPSRIKMAVAGVDEGMERVHLVAHDLTLPITWDVYEAFEGVTKVVNVASESHVDRSIAEPDTFIRNNVNLMLELLEWARQHQGLEKFLQVNTDEVFGPAPDGVNWDVDAPIRPSNPYSASKAAQAAIAHSYRVTYGVPVIVSQTMNIIGEGQDREKFVPLVIGRLLRGEEILVHGSKEGRSGSRFYLHARNQADALLTLLGEKGVVGNYYNVVGEQETTNWDLVHIIAGLLKEAGHDVEVKARIVDFHSARPGHDLRYALDGRTMTEIGWNAPIGFVESLRRTVEWYIKNPDWL